MLDPDEALDYLDFLESRAVAGEDEPPRDAANTARIAYGLRRQATEALVALQDEEDRRQMKAALARWASEQARRSSGLPNLRTFQDFRISEV